MQTVVQFDVILMSVTADQTVYIQIKSHTRAYSNGSDNNIQVNHLPRAADENHHHRCCCWCCFETTCVTYGCGAARNRVIINGKW